MTKDDIMRMARQAWFETGEGWTATSWFDDRAKSFERFAELVAAASRAAVADACEKSVDGWKRESPWECGYVDAMRDIAEDLRARGKQ